MTLAAKEAELAKKLGVAPVSTAGDDVGIGKGVCDRIGELTGVYPGVNVGSHAEDKDRFLNLRAELYWKTAEWLKQGSKLVGRGSFDEILDVRWKTQSTPESRSSRKKRCARKGLEAPTWQML